MGGFSARSVCVTINNPEIQLEFSDERVRYAVWQKEKGAEGTEHYQCYIEFSKPLSLKAIKEIVGDKAHIEARKGTRDQARDYCMKSDTRIEGPFEYGSWNAGGQGTRSDLNIVAMHIQMSETISLRDIAHEFPVAYIKYNRGLEKLVNLKRLPRDPNHPPKVEWVYGPTGCGKTRYATTAYGDNYYIKDHTQWWDGYEQQPVIIIDDFDGRWPYRDLLRLLDRYPYQGQVKGGYIHINSPNIIITADRRPEAVYDSLDKAEISQLLRRIIIFEKFLLQSPGYEVAGNTKPPLTDEETVKKKFDDFD